MAEVERPTHGGLQGVEQQAEESVVSRLEHLDADRAEPVAELRDRLGRRVHSLDAAEGRHPAGEGDAEPEAGRGLVGPALELVLGGKTPERRIELDRVQPGRVEAQEVSRLRIRRVEAAFPGRVREAGRAGVEAGGRYEPSMTS